MKKNVIIIPHNPEPIAKLSTATTSLKTEHCLQQTVANITSIYHAALVTLLSTYFLYTIKNLRVPVSML
jgi:hypothetical protein